MNGAARKFALGEKRKGGIIRTTGRWEGFRRPIGATAETAVNVSTHSFRYAQLGDEMNSQMFLVSHTVNFEGLT